MSDEQTGVVLPIPLPEDHAFRYQAMDDILTVLVRNPHHEFSVSQLRTLTGHGGKTVTNGLDLLQQLDLVRSRRDGNKKLNSINRDRVQKPEDPIIEISQEVFRTPVKTFLDELQDEVDNLVGVLVFGSVARGKADRASDIDLFIVVENNLMETRRMIQAIRQTVSDQQFKEGRYEFQVMVESLESAEQYGEKLQTIFSEGITLYQTEHLDDLRRGVLHGE